MLDLIDKKIIYHLDENARQSLSLLAKKLKIGRNVALYRLNKLKEEGIIKGSYAEINTLALRYLSFRVFIKLGVFSKQDEESLINFFQKEKSLTWLTRVIGRWDLDIVYTVKDIGEFEEFRKNLFTNYNKIIEECSISLMTAVHRYPKDYLIGNQRKSTKADVVEITKPFEIDEKDREILDILTKDASTNIVDISRKVKLSINTVKKKIKELEENRIILGYRLFLNSEKLGYEYYKLHVNFRNYTGKDIINFRNWLASKNFVIYTDHYINGEDFEIELHLKNEREYLNFLQELKEKFGEILKDSFVIKFYDSKVFTYLPSEKN